VQDALEQWDTPASVFAPEVRLAYERALEDPQHAHAICEEYRGAAVLDPEHDRVDRDLGRCIACPVLAVWSGKGALEKWYWKDGGPIGIWKKWAKDVRGYAVDAGHFFPEEQPGATAKSLMDFFSLA
jgi:haloacetate dehalogenase